MLLMSLAEHAPSPRRSTLKVDPAELFSPDISNGALARSPYSDTSARLLGLSTAEHVWVQGILDAILRDH